jgi:lysine/ornithine N-monooxygenase
MRSVAILGAGPYGLAAAAHLRAAGVPARHFGRTMAYWREHMPDRMMLRSIVEASHISDPGSSFSLDRYTALRGRSLPDPIPIADFIAYGEWFQQHAAPDVDPRRVAQVSAADGGFLLRLEDGEHVTSDRVVVAAGLAPFPHIAPELRELPPELLSHSSVHQRFDAFAGRRVLVVGGGQSALESAALLSEASAEVEVVIRAPEIRWLAPGAMKQRSERLHRILYPPSDVGPPGLNWLVFFPRAWQQLPLRQRRWVAARCIRPAAAGWLLDRLTPVKMTLSRRIRAVAAGDATVRVALDDGSERTVDHVVAATGFRVDAARYEFLGRDLLTDLRLVDGYPVLRAGFESSIPGLHFLGAPSAASFGPIMRFVAGTRYTGPALARAIATR